MAGPVVLHDEDVERLLTPERAVASVRDAVLAHHAGTFLAPPRTSVGLGDGPLVVTAGRVPGRWYGHRAYDNRPVDGDDSVVLHDDATGALRAVAVGRALGLRRSGAMGALALAALVPGGARTVAVIGAGVQASAQVWAMATWAVPDAVRVHARDPRRCAAFADEVSGVLHGAQVEAVGAVRDAVDGAEVVVVATSSPEPVLDPAWLAPGAHVSTVGTKQVGRAEVGADLYATASLVVTDSPDQVDAYDPPHVVAGTPSRGRLQGLGALLADGAARPSGDGPTVFTSVGLAGTEVWLLADLVRDRPDFAR